MNKCLFLLLCLQFTEANAQQFVPVQTDLLSQQQGDFRSVNWVDYDNDGKIDLFITEGSKQGGNNIVFRNYGEGQFGRVEAGDLTSDRLPSVGASWTDVDNDGDLDAFVTSWYDQPSILYVNDGKGKLNRVIDRIPPVPGYAETSCWTDFNSDGLPDLFVTRSAGNKLNCCFVQQKEPTFSTVSLPEKHASRNVTLSDVDQDGDADILVTNEQAQSGDFYRNDSGKLVPFFSSGLTDDAISTMSSSAMDVDNDGDPDVLLISEKESPRLLLNDGKGTFSHSKDSVFTSLKGHFVGSNYADIDNDGDIDLYITAAFGQSENEKNCLLINSGNGKFKRDTAMQQPQGWSYGCAFGDYDRDGFMDLAVANCSAGSFPNVLYHNTGNANHWLEINCEGTSSGQSALGTKVRVKSTVNGKSVWQVREITAQTGYCGQNMQTVHFGMGAATTCDSLLIEWPSGKIDHLERFHNDQQISIKQHGVFQLENRAGCRLSGRRYNGGVRAGE